MADGMKLPTELMLLIKELVPHSDLRTHVCYYKTCRTIASLYGDSSAQADFWRRACLLSGIGWLKADASWKEIAFETIERDGFCRHPGCGGALLDWNAKQVAHAMHLWNWDPDDGPWDASVDYTRGGLSNPAASPKLVCSPAFRHVAFRGSARGAWSVDTADVVLRRPDGFVITELAQHSVVARSYATFPFATKLLYDFGDEVFPFDDVRNESGVTVWDVVHLLLYCLDLTLEMPDMSAMLTGSFSCIFDKMKHSPDFLQDLSRFSTLRGLWSATRCEDMEFVQNTTDGPVCALKFSLLPEEEYKRRVAIYGAVGLCTE